MHADRAQLCLLQFAQRGPRATTRLYDDFLKPSGLRTTRYSVLMAVRGPVTVTKLAGITITDRTTFTRNLTVLEKKGLVTIEPGEERRERLVTVTERGGEAPVAAIPLREAAQAHIERGPGGDRVGGLLEDLSAIISISKKE